MSHDVKLTSGKGSIAERIADRLKNSGAGAKPDQTVSHGSGPTRVHTNLHHSGGQGGVQHDKVDIVQKTAQEINTPQGQAIVSAVAAYLGVDPQVTAIGLAAVQQFGQPAKNQQDSSGLIQSPVGYTICYAVPSNPNAGAGDKGIETHNQSTFNATAVRVIPGKYDFDGIGWIMSIPFSVSSDSRVTASFDVVMVKADPGWQAKFPCRPTGEHAWLAKNNHTDLNVPCAHGAGPWCPN